MSVEKLKPKLLKYENLKIEAKLLDQQIKELAADLAPQLPEDETIDTGNGTFTVARKTKWKYSKELISRIDAIEKAKTLEEQDGTAKAVKGDPYIIYKQHKAE